MEITGLINVHLKFVGTMGHDDKKRDNPVLNATCGHRIII